MEDDAMEQEVSFDRAISALRSLDLLGMDTVPVKRKAGRHSLGLARGRGSGERLTGPDRLW